MGRVRFLSSNFTAGELHPRIHVRSDLQKFFAGVEFLENFQILVEGGMAKRSGTLAWGRTPADGRALLVPFVRSAFDAVMLELTHLKLRVWLPDHDLQRVAGGAVYELATPWTEAMLPWLVFTQAAAPDLIVTHRSGQEAPWGLVRQANGTWSVENWQAENGPFLPLQSPPVSLSASGTTGAVTLTASQPVFTAAQVGGLIRIRENAGNPPVTRWEAAKAVATGDLRLNGGRVYRAAAAGTTGTTAPIHWEGTVSDGAVSWQFVHDGAGLVRVDAVASGTSATATVLQTLPSTGATTFWNEGAFSEARGWPRAACQHAERIWTGGTEAQPDTLFGSVVAGYFETGADYKPGLGTGLVVDSDAVTRTLTGGRVRPVQHLVSAGALHVFCPKHVILVTGPSDREPITPAGAAAVSRPGLGSSPWVTPVVGASEILYASFSGQRLLGMPWSETGSDGASRDLSVLSAHMLADSPIRQVALVEEPDPTVYVLREDGQLLAMAYSPEQNVAGWWRVALGGGARVDAIAVMERPDGRDELWLVAARTVGGATRRTIETLPGLRPWAAPADLSARLDGALFWDAWNGDSARTVTVAGPVQRGGQTTVTATHPVFAGIAIGRELWLRKDRVVDGRGVMDGPVRLRVETVNSATSVAVTALSDCDSTWTGQPLAGWALALQQLSGLDIWQGASLNLFADYELLDPVTVASGGTVQLPRPSCRGFAGWPFDARVRLLPLDVAGDIGSSFGASVRADQMALLLLDGVEVLVGPRGRVPEAVRLRHPSELLSQPPQPGAGVRKLPLAGDTRERIDVEMTAPGPWPCELVGLSLRVTSDG